MTRPTRRQHLIQTAATLFARHGYHATGVDAILATAGVSKKTLYSHFRSKEELILAALRDYDGRFRNDFMRQVERAAGPPGDRLLAVFDVAELWFCGEHFYGCMFINAIAEYSQRQSAIRSACQEFKRLLREYMQELAEQAGAAHPAELADALALLLEGATVTAQLSAQPGAARTARRVAALLIAQATAAGPPAPVSGAASARQ